MVKRTEDDTAARKAAKRVNAARKLMEAFRATPPCAFHRTARKALYR